MYTVYAIRSHTSNYIYKGLTSNLEERLLRHDSGYEKTTKPYLPFELIYTKEFSRREDARLHEKYLKSGEGREMLRKLE
jgi:putative endonuclease